jgi:hypothetical protein
LTPVIKEDDREAVFAIVSWLDEKMGDGEFAVVDKFLGEMDLDKIYNPGYLLACLNYVRIAKDRGDHLENGPTFRDRAAVRMCELVGGERAERLLKNR